MPEGHESTRLGGIDEEIPELIEVGKRNFTSMRM